MAWHIGQSAVCITGDYSCFPRPIPLKGEVYTVSEILDEAPYDETGLQFVELRFEGDEEFFPGFKASAFRPVRTTKVGLGILKGLLTPKPAKTVKASA